MDLDQERLDEITKYISAYKYPEYRMGDLRKASAQGLLMAAPSRESFLDIGCGRGEMLDYAKELGFVHIEGTEVVPELIMRDRVRFAQAHNLPYEDGAFDIVSCLDVLEHLVPADTERVLCEIDRVAARQIILTANNKPSKSLGTELHVNKRPYPEWDRLIRDCTRGEVAWINRGFNISETWTITRD